ncbi:Mth938-like domain-containing protein [Lutimaribacter sp. EGI FJ00015]|uniref:Mth938-like domain-containing protein n=1 Tax=Lutimaribacter degradans TaxID=2945989 RepID=A0ACC5ZVW4_9RHOB|nr:Mth938-like domain-containing protein [Lutimaribacter sp. EGI FJ00013]MCM2562477.1 Mth938-like domain-containing protein [Lutimaribacter sp. EGI FJ00013]MCO0613634.1 Mth938-like domain-containing protein [Lutimaribacter sp. EGI FJ00015]MCO0636606.1 Mth938-like domain-containing protein [Lutimaribacter sp. EGI FJ00014]
MEMNEIRYDSAVPVDGYGPGFFRVDGALIEGAMIATGERAVGWAGLDDPAPLEALAGEVDVVFLGMGAEIAHAPRALRDRLEEMGLGVEVMSSPAACRSYNVLLAEGRRVALAVLPV